MTYEFESHHPLSQVSLTAEDTICYRWVGGRQREIGALYCELMVLNLFLEGDSPRIDRASFDGIRAAMDELRMIIAAIPAWTLADLHTKVIALDGFAPILAEHGALPTIAEASIRADISRLKPKPQPDWLRLWLKRR